MMLRVIQELAYIPEGATIVKLGGTDEHTVKDEIVIYAKDPALTQRIKPPVGYRFLVRDEGHSISLEEMGTCFVWHTSLEELNDLDIGEYPGSGE